MNYPIRGLATWTWDEYEQCSCDARNAVRELLGIREQWPCVTMGTNDQRR